MGKSRSVVRRSNGRHAQSAQGPVSLSKITAPRIGNVFLRRRLFKQLGDASALPAVWLSGPAGSGKTTLVASYLDSRKMKPLWYQMDDGDVDLAGFFHFMRAAAPKPKGRQEPLPTLTPEYFSGLSTFVRNFFRELFARMPKPGALVLDNFQDLPDSAPLRDLMPVVLAEIPPDLQVFIVSRSDPPPSLARMATHNQLGYLSWKDLRLTDEEAHALAKLRLGASRYERSVVNEAMNSAQGWMAGLILLLEQRQHRTDNLDTEPSADAARSFDYFASEIFARTAPSEQQVLLRTAYLPRMSPEAVIQLSQNPQAPAILKRLVSHNFFTNLHADGFYEYHPLFRSFLIAQLQSRLPGDEIRAIQSASATALADRGDLAAAVELLQQAQAWDQLCGLLLTHARALLEQGRGQALLRWLGSLPEAVFCEHPWVLFWQGICLLPMNQPGARTFLEKAYFIFEQGEAGDPVFLTWSAIVDSYVMEWEDYEPVRPWLDRYPTLGSQRSNPSPDVESASLVSYVSACVYARPELPELDTRIQQALSLINTDVRRWFIQGAMLAFALTIMRKLSDAVPLFQMLNRCVQSHDLPPHEMILWSLIQGARAWFVDYPDQCARHMSEGLALGEKHGIHVYDNVLSGLYSIGELTSGNIAAARESANRFLPSVQGSGGKAALLIYCGGAVSFQEGRLQQALEEFGQSVQYSNNSHWDFGDAMNGMPLAVLNAKIGDSNAGLAKVKEYVQLAYRINSPVVKYFSHFAQAKVHWWRNEIDLALESTKMALQIARLDGRTALPSWLLREEASSLLNRALEANVEADWARTFIDKCRLPAPPNVTSDAWPFPIKIYTLGRFGLLRDEHSVAGGGAAKPIEFLKALIALGGRDIAQEQLTDALWSDAEGDAGRRSFDITLHRLRKMLGHEDVLPLVSGRLSLDPRYCWVDAWSLEREMTVLDKMVRHSPNSETIQRHLQRLWSLYRGPFLRADRSHSFAIAMRERLHVRLVALVRNVGLWLENEGCHDAATQCYEQALAIDPLLETFYRRLIRLHVQCGRQADARRVYERCRQSLMDILGVPPSADTEATLHASMTSSTP